MKDSDLKYAARMWMICVAMPCLALVIIGVIACATANAQPSPTPTAERCFPAADWGPAPDSLRPCVRLTGNDPERGALRFTVSDASGVVRYAGYVNIPTNPRINRVRILNVAEDGSFAYSANGHTGTVGNLQD